MGPALHRHHALVRDERSVIEVARVVAAGRLWLRAPHLEFRHDPRDLRLIRFNTKPDESRRSIVERKLQGDGFGLSNGRGDRHPA